MPIVHPSLGSRMPMTIRHRVLSFSSDAAAVEANFEKVMAQGPTPKTKHLLRRLAKKVLSLIERARTRFVEISEELPR